MARLGDVVDGIAIWIGFGFGSFGALFLVMVGVGLVSAGVCLTILRAQKHAAAAELAHYGSSLRSPRSFVCKVCLHRSYAESHIRRNYCARCDRTFPGPLKVWDFQAQSRTEYPAGSQTGRYRDLTKSAGPDRRRTRA
jgi:hypothetical protein